MLLLLARWRIAVVLCYLAWLAGSRHGRPPDGHIEDWLYIIQNRLARLFNSLNPNANPTYQPTHPYLPIDLPDHGVFLLVLIMFFSLYLYTVLVYC